MNHVIVVVVKNIRNVVGDKMNDLNKDFEVIKKLEELGVEKNCIYLLDLIPLIEVAWADGRIQDIEVVLMQKFLKEHIAKINKRAGTEIIRYDEASNFLTGFLKKRPDPEIMKILREMAISCHFNKNKEQIAETQKINILQFCLDIAANAVTHYPYGADERFDISEKKVFIDIMRSLDISTDRNI